MQYTSKQQNSTENWDEGRGHGGILGVVTYGLAQKKLVKLMLLCSYQNWPIFSFFPLQICNKIIIEDAIKP